MMATSPVTVRYMAQSLSQLHFRVKLLIICAVSVRSSDSSSVWPLAAVTSRIHPSSVSHRDKSQRASMFENLTDRLSATLRSISGKARLSEENIQDSLREVRRALLEADVALPVVKDFIDRVQLRAVGTEVSKSLSPGQAFIKIVQAELQAVMGEANE